MAYHVELEFAAKSDTGLVRSHNEDSIAFSESYGFAILADGMGGYNAGEVASGIATQVLKESLEERLRNQQWEMRSNWTRRMQQVLSDSIAHTNASIIEAARIKPQYSGMGTTLVLALFYHDKVMVAHVGDSRAYRLRQNKITQITRDHSLLQEQLDAGLITPEIAEFSQNRNLITRAMGVDRDVEVEIHDHVTEAGDLYILCSDGLSDMLTDQEITSALSSASNLETACSTLVKKANDRGGRDNISVVLTRVNSDHPGAEGLFERLFYWIK
jgi:protein phosphatase